ncbi:MAG: mandelate racemase/muconate lactonizing enzyme family protein [Acidobacteria bacterium]|nr:mandelate racemase/muconate lactonizing enzyme family protein [Acidobacteriota bacterium]
MNRRAFLLGPLAAAGARARVKLTEAELIPVRATARTVWLFIRLRSDAGVEGLGEASDAFGIRGTTVENAGEMREELRKQFAELAGRSPFDIEYFRQSARLNGLLARTVHSALEQAMWDMAGNVLDAPVYSLLGGKVRDRLPVYANINRTTSVRTPEGFAATAKRAVADGFQAVKLAPWDNFVDSDAFVDRGIQCLFAVREAVGKRVQIMTDCHSFFTVERAKRVAKQLEPVGLSWYEEPVAPEKTAETLAIRRAIQQEMAGGEFLFGVKEFAPLCREKAVDVIMPDVKHCGGVLEMTRIAAMADLFGVSVAPHNPTGPVSTAASVQLCAGMRNFRILELQWSEVEWRGALVRPAERFENGTIAVGDGPGFGIRLNEALTTEKRMV